jgi:ribulose-phosphate 3-epimerase
MAVSIAPSILSADFLRLEQEVRDVVEAGADLLHVDVMDGHFVPNITIGPMIVEALTRQKRVPLDVHLMIAEPAAFVENFADAGADIITVHAEADNHLFRTIDVIKGRGKKAGVSLNPATPLAAIEHLLGVVDLLLIMTVNPGFGGQHYIDAMDEKIRAARSMIRKSGRPIHLEVDGGIKATNAGHVVALGADILVMGTEIFHSGDYRKKFREIRQALRKGSKAQGRRRRGERETR